MSLLLIKLIKFFFIYSRQTWKRLRNQYLNLQRERIKFLKRHVRAEQPPKRPNKPTPTKPIKSARNINFYGALADTKKDDDDEEEPPNKKQKIPDILNKKPLFTYEPGLIVAMKLSEPCVEIRNFKVC